MSRFENKYHITGTVITLMVAEAVLWIVLVLLYIIFADLHNSFQFGQPAVLWLLPASALIAVAFAFMLRRKNNSLSKFAEAGLLRYLVPEISTTWNIVRFIIYRFGVALVIVALAMPQYGIKEVEATSEGVDIVLAIDVSRSMNAEDIKPNRLERAKLAIESLLKQLKGDRIGVVVFAGSADVLVPLTTDYTAIKDFMAELTTDYPVQGTSISDAIETAEGCFDLERASSKAIIIISDGEDHEQEALGAAETAKKNGIIVHAIGLGSADGVAIPIYDGDRQIGYKKDEDGSTVITKLDENTLKGVASKGGGVYIRGKEAQFGLGAIMDKVNEMEAEENVVSRKFLDYEDHFYVYLMIGIFLLIVEQFLPQKSFKNAEV